jgi:anti-anti-sigma factor
MLDTLQRMGRRPRTLILRMGRVPYVDSTAAHALQRFIIDASSRGTEVRLCELNANTATVLEMGGVLALVAANTDTLESALAGSLRKP